MPTRLENDLERRNEIVRSCKPRYYQGVGYRQDAEEQHHQQEEQVEVTVLRGLEHRLVGDVGNEDCRALEVEHEDQLDQVQYGQPRGHEESHPDHPLVVDGVQDVLGNIELRIAREGFL